jgi:hypothetical protein
MASDDDDIIINRAKQKAQEVGEKAKEAGKQPTKVWVVVAALVVGVILGAWFF